MRASIEVADIFRAAGPAYRTARAAEVPRTRPVVVYCQSGVRSAQAVALLRRDFGYDNVLTLSGGLEDYPG